jgi:hypothetical protein
MKTRIALALAVSASLCLAGCASPGAISPNTQQVIDTGSSIARAALPALKIMVSQDGLDPATVQAVSDYIDVAQVVVDAVQGGSAACAGVDRATCIYAAIDKALDAGDRLLANPAVSKAIGVAAGPRVQAAVSATRKAVLAARNAQAAATSTDKDQRTALAVAALFDLNLAVLQGVQAAR